MELRKIFGFLLLVIVSADIVSAWDQDDLDIFDLVEEINENFYTILEVQQVIEYFQWERKVFSLLVLMLNSFYYRMLHQRKFGKHFVCYQFVCIQIKMMQRMQMYNSEIWSPFMKFWKIHRNDKSKIQSYFKWIYNVILVDFVIQFSTTKGTIRCWEMECQIGNRHFITIDAIEKWAWPKWLDWCLPFSQLGSTLFLGLFMLKRNIRL